MTTKQLIKELNRIFGDGFCACFPQKVIATGKPKIYIDLEDITLKYNQLEELAKILGTKEISINIQTLDAKCERCRWDEKRGYGIYVEGMELEEE